MRVYRLERERYLHETLSGKRAALSHGNRWNPFGTAMVYTAQSRSLALLEALAHVDLNEDLPNDRWMVEIDLPDHLPLARCLPLQLPDGWYSKPPVNASPQLGEAFVKAGQAVALKVPNVIVPQEWNYLINPLLPDAAAIQVVGALHWPFDPRL